MTDPFVLCESGLSYEHWQIEKWIENYGSVKSEDLHNNKTCECHRIYLLCSS